ncbi:hypothetical protein AMATHDRAFT_40867 [Amanita thiersii Skay4041]|uniref:Nucleoporin NUP188 n=1 Tax=Amanita thiersii Skay4041 TaxID=703135 RepID=A0A2A9NK14_9AGAR|nr:hypothetical protein AMATHDRAFT_40867 [Amanita thiersii Skay4041]
MSGESSSTRSSLIDVTYSQLHSILSGHQEGYPPDQITHYLETRRPQLSNVSEPFGKPSDASRKKVESGSVVLEDGVVVRVESGDKEFVFAISERFKIDEIQALVLLRSFLYNEGLPPTADDSSTSSMIAELLEAITPFYYSERLSILRVFLPLFRAKEEMADPIYDISCQFLPKLLPDGVQFAQNLITTYECKLAEKLPESMRGEPRTATRWAKQNYRECLALLEVLFWTMWGFVPCNGVMVERIYEVAYHTVLGSELQNGTLLLDDEGVQLREDCAALWMLIMVEVLELENVAERDGIELSTDPVKKDFYIASSDSLKRIHELVMAHADGQYAVIYLAWAYVLSRLSAKSAEMQDIPAPYRPFFDIIKPPTPKTDPIHTLMVNNCLAGDAELFRLLLRILTTSPLFVTSIAWKTGSSVTDPNAIAFRSVLKGLLISLVELIPVEMIPDFDGLVDVWTTLFGRSEGHSIGGICVQFWQTDWQHGIARRAIFDVARSRFPIHVRPLLRLLRSMTAAGFLDTDLLSTTDHSNEGDGLTTEREICDRFVFHYLDNLPTYSQVIPINACSGPHALYERVQERYGSPHSSAGLIYQNLRPIKLPGGSILPAKATGRILSSDGGDYIVICWQHQHSGWKLILEVLTDYVNRRRLQTGSGTFQELSFGHKGPSQILTLRLEDIGVDVETDAENMIMNCLDLVRSLVQGNPIQAERLMQSLESGEHVVAHTMTEMQAPDLVQLTIMILEDAMSRSDPRHRNFTRIPLITSALSVLSALLALPHYSNRVWLFLRSTTALFSSEKTVGLASVALAAERATGHYTTTFALLHLVQQLFREASTSFIASNNRLQQLKEEVLLRAARFVHTEIWIEHLGWKYVQLGDRFEIGRRVVALYVAILEYSPPNTENRPFPILSQSVADAFLFKASSSTLNPLVVSIASSRNILDTLYAARRYGDARRLLYLLQSCLHLTHMVLSLKLKSVAVSKPSLLEQALCTRVSGIATPVNARSKLDPIDILALYVKERDVGTTVPVEAARLLTALCSCLSCIQPPPTTIIGHLSNPESTVSSLVRIVQHPYDELVLRNAVWAFIALAVDKEPALAGLFVTGKFLTPNDIKGKHLPLGAAKNDKEGQKKEVKDESKGKEKELEVKKEGAKDTTPANANGASALNVAYDFLLNWKDMWEANPHLLASVLKFLDTVWRHGLEHKIALEPLRKNSEFWKQLVGIVKMEIGPSPEYETSAYVATEGVRHSDLHEVVAIHAYRTLVKSYAINIITLDIANDSQAQQVQTDSPKKPSPLSFQQLEACFKTEEQLRDLLTEAAPSPYSPELHDGLVMSLKTLFEGLDLEQLRLPEPLEQRELGDDFVFSTPLLKSRLHAYHLVNGDKMYEQAQTLEKQLMSVNLNLSLTHAQSALTESWQPLLRQVMRYLRGDGTVRQHILSVASSISYDIASERRSGDMVASIHGSRLSLLLAMLELAWFSTMDKPLEIQHFVEVVKNVHGIILNEAQPPARSFLGELSTPFHGVLLQIIYFCARQGRSLARRPKTLKADQRLTILAVVEVTLNLVIDALHTVFLSARSTKDVDLDRDMELLVAVFEQCTRKDLNPSSTSWLARCQETDVIRTSLDLYAHVDLVGVSDLPLLISRKQPLYVPHILLFHMALVSNATAAERFASEGVLSAYSNNSISGAISAGLIDVMIPELSGERSPAHTAYCSMLSIVAAVLSALGRGNHYFDSEAAGFIQLYGNQISRALSWTVGDAITWALLEEIEQVVNLFYALASNAPSRPSSTNSAVEKILRAFSISGLKLLQQLNYAIIHPNHLASLFEPVTAEERTMIEKEQSYTGYASDPLGRPLVLQLIHRLFKLSSNILGTLLAISRADMVLLSPQDDWPLQEALVVPHSKVVPGEPASMGTLLELGNCTLDVLRDLVNRPAGQSLLPISATPPKPSDPCLNVRQGVLTARRNLESILTYAVTQLAMWLLKPEFEPSLVPGAGESMGALDVGMDDAGVQVGGERMDVVMGGGSVSVGLSGASGGGKDHRGVSRSSTTLADRVRRGMTGEVAADLQALITKAKPILLKSDSIIGASGGGSTTTASAGGSVDLMDVLGRFLQERVITPAS